jgi:hypothetical protein
MISRVTAVEGGNSNGSTPRTERIMMNGQRKMRQYKPTNPKNKVMSTRLSCWIRSFRSVV